MKKLLILCLTVLMIPMMVACGGNTDSNAPKLEGVEAPVDILNTVWNSYTEDTKFFAMGGDFNNIVDNAPGAVDVTDADTLASQFVCPADAAAMIDGAASLVHAMNANTFTGVAYHIAEGADAAAFITAMQTAVENNQWMCGFPEKLMIATVSDEYVVVAFGAADLIDTFKTNLTAAYSITEVSVEKALA